MSEPFYGELKLFAFGRAPTGWSLCNGAILNVSQNQTLYNLIGTKFGGSPSTTFALPDLRGRTPLGLAATAPDTTRSAYPTDGLNGGSEKVLLTAGTVPAHSHTVRGVKASGSEAYPAAGLLASPASISPGSTTDFSVYLPAADWTADSTLAPGTVGKAGGDAAHENMQPFLVLNFCIATSGAISPKKP
jgi:microcystin-dependent protein